MARALMLVASNTRDETRVDEFNEWYSRHVEELLQLDGIVSATRWQLSPHQLLPGADGVAGSWRSTRSNATTSKPCAIGSARPRASAATASCSSSIRCR